MRISDWSSDVCSSDLLPTGETAYTRAGSLQLSPDGDIVTSDGYIVQPGITVPNDAVSITVNESGEVYVDLDGQVAPVRVGQLELANFANEAGLDAIGQNLLLETAASGQRSEERRVGKECGSQCRSRWSTYH